LMRDFVRFLGVASDGAMLSFFEQRARIHVASKWR
jgi:hypothetical protein